MDTIAALLSPLIALMRIMLEILHSAVSSYGLAIILLSIAIRLLMTPILQLAVWAEERHARAELAMAPTLADIHASYIGRERFERTEAVYKAHGYHPIQSIVSLAPLLLQLPFLLAAMFLLTGYEALEGQGFVFIGDISRSDRLLSIGGITIHILPLLLTATAITESLIKRNVTVGSRLKFAIVATVIAVLIYPLPAAVCLYWLTSNIWSLGSEILLQRRIAM